VARIVRILANRVASNTYLLRLFALELPCGCGTGWATGSGHRAGVATLSLSASSV